MSLENPFQENNIVTKPSSLLSTSTILSIIGSAIAMISAVTAYVNAEVNYEKIQKMVNDKDVAKAPEFVKSFFNENALLMAQKAVENKVPIMIISLIAAALCLFGAVMTAMYMFSLYKNLFIVNKHFGFVCEHDTFFILEHFKTDNLDVQE
jgi:hypothetical protein